ncbi:hypothetical protein [Actinomadura kijaniata]|uniref:hypothetical protein n=1 Tax=Actinomadura kijaniata TaxID=46161 RepID=UPI00082A5D91|nr:hypothetical protein [Actinomadura kijaniata]
MTSAHRHRRRFLLGLPPLAGVLLILLGFVLGPPAGQWARERAAGIGTPVGPGEPITLVRDDDRFAPRRAVYRHSPPGGPATGGCQDLESPGGRPYRTSAGWEHVGTSLSDSVTVRCQGPPGTRFAAGNVTTEVDAAGLRYVVTGFFLLMAFLVLAVSALAFFLVRRRPPASVTASP